MATQIVATASKLRSSCEHPVAVDLYEKLVFALQRLGLVEEMQDLEEDWFDDDAIERGGARHDNHGGFCKVCLQVENDRDSSLGVGLYSD